MHPPAALIRVLQARALPVLAGTLLILLVVAINGRPGLFADTDDYLVNGRNTVMTVAYALHLKTAPEPSDDADQIEQDRQEQLELRLQFGSRTPWYGVPLYALQKLGTLWLVAAVQSAIAAWLIWLTWRALAPKAPGWTAYAAEGVGVVGSTLPFFAGFAMPDVFAGFTALGVALLIGAWGTWGSLEIAGLTLLIAYGVTVHGSIPLLTLALLAVGMAATWLLHRPRRTILASAACVAGALAAGVAIGALSMAAVKWTTGDTPGRPPFLSVRLLADGPGRGYLKRACDHGAAYALCRFRNLPLDDTEEILWSDNPKLGIYETSDYPTRLRLVREDLSFAVGTVLSDPVGVAASSMRNWGSQIVKVWAEEPLRDPYYYLTNDYWKDTNLPALVYAMGDCGTDHHGCKPRFGPAQSGWWDSFTFVLALAAIGWRLAQRDVREALARRADDETTQTLLILGLVLAALALNALICGAISGPFIRYQGRISWIAVVAAAAVLAGAYRARER